MGTGVALAWTFAKRFWPLFVIVPLAFAILFMRNTISRQDGEIKVAKVEVANLTKANEQNAKVIETFKQMQVDNEAIAQNVAALLAGNNTREVHTREVIERLKNDDPVVRDWANQPVPIGVRRAIAAPN